MPRVPTLPQVEERALPGVKVAGDAPLAAFGGGDALAGFSNAVQKTGGTLIKLVEEEKRNANDVAATGAWSDLSKKKNDLVYNPETGAMTRKGKNAFGVVEEFGTKFDQLADEIEEGLANEDQKALFRRIRAKERQELDTHLQRHVYAESKAFDEETTKSGLAAARENALLNFTDPKKIQESIAMQRVLLTSYAGRQGLSTDGEKLLMQEAESETHTGVIQRMLTQGQDLAAKRYFEANREGLTGKHAQAVEKALEEGSIRGESQRQADALWQKAGGNLTAAMKLARGIEDPKVRDETERRLEHRAGAEERAQRLGQDKLYERWALVLEQSKGDLDKVPPGVMASLSAGHRKALRDYADNLRRGIEPERNSPDYYNLKQMAATPELQAKFLETNLMIYKPTVAGSDLHELIQLQTSLRNKDSKADEVLNGFRSTKQVVDEAFEAAGFSANPKTDKEAEKLNKFHKAVDDEIRLHQAQTGKKVSTEEAQKIADRLLIKQVTHKGWFWDTKRAGFEVDEEVPEEERKVIESKLRSRGMRPTPEMIFNVYQKSQEKKRGN